MSYNDIKTTEIATTEGAITPSTNPEPCAVETVTPEAAGTPEAAPTAKTGVRFVLGLLTGALIGAATAVVLAPQSGRQTREMLKVKADEARVKAGEVALELNKDLGEWTEKTKTLVVKSFRERLAQASVPTSELTPAAAAAESPEVAELPVSEQPSVEPVLETAPVSPAAPQAAEAGWVTKSKKADKALAIPVG
jgi:gas vesicle protein